MENILVYATPFEIEKGKWGYKWIGFCYGKRFSVIFNPYETEMIIDTENGNYLFYEKQQRKSLPTEIKKLTYEKPLSNHYFLLNKGKSVSLEVVMMLIEKGYNIENIVMNPYIKYTKGNYDDQYLCQYLERETKKIIVEILNDESVLWKEDDIID